MTQKGSARIDGDMVTITIPRDRVHALMVAVRACHCTDCRAAQSVAAEATRNEFLASLRRVLGWGGKHG